MLIDSHCHLTDSKFFGKVEDVVKRARENNIETMLTICIEFNNDANDSFANVLNLVNDSKYPDIFGACGLHPEKVEHSNKENIPTTDFIIQQAKSSKKIIAIGETGLDFQRPGNEKNQKQSFINHLQASSYLDFPVVIHSRDADKEMIDILKSEIKNSPFQGIMHCFTASRELAEAALELGLYISFSGILTFNSAKNVQEIAKFVPLDRILIETDSPYLAPSPHRGKVNEPAFVKFVAEFLANLRQIEYHELQVILKNNFYSLFKNIHCIKNIY